MFPSWTSVDEGAVWCWTYFSDGVDIDIIFGPFRVRDERFHQKLPQDTLNGLDLL